jgi:hypothetical protein
MSGADHWMVRATHATRRGGCTMITRTTSQESDV